MAVFIPTLFEDFHHFFLNGKGGGSVFVHRMLIIIGFYSVIYGILYILETILRNSVPTRRVMKDFENVPLLIFCQVEWRNIDPLFQAVQSMTFDSKMYGSIIL